MDFRHHPFLTRLVTILTLEFFIFTQLALAAPFEPYRSEDSRTSFYLSPEEIKERSQFIEELIKRQEDIRKAMEAGRVGEEDRQGWSNLALRLNDKEAFTWSKFFDETYNFKEVQDLRGYPLGRSDYEKNFSKAILSRIINHWGLGEERELSLPYLFDAASSYSIPKALWRTLSKDSQGCPVLREDIFYGLPLGGDLLSGGELYSKDGRVIILATRYINLDLSLSSSSGLSDEDFELIKSGYGIKKENPWETYKAVTSEDATSGLEVASSWDEILLSREKERLADEFLLDLRTPSLGYKWLGQAIRLGEEVGELAYTPAFVDELVSKRDYDPARAEVMARSLAYLLKEVLEDKNYSQGYIDQLAASLKEELLKNGTELPLSLSASYAEVEEAAQDLRVKIFSNFVLPLPQAASSAASSLSPFSLTILPLKNDGTSSGHFLSFLSRSQSDVYFKDGELIREIYPDHEIVNFSYEKDKDGAIQRIYGREGGRTRVYNGEGQLVEVRSGDGSIIEYEGELIRRVSDNEGKITDFTYLRDAANEIFEIHLQNKDSNQVYDRYGTLISLSQKDGSTLEYLTKPLGKYIDQFGQAHLYQVIEQNGLTRQTLLDPTGILQVFDDKDNILSVATPYGYKLFYTDGGISRIDLPENISIDLPVFNREGILISASINLADRGEASLSDSRVILPDGTAFTHSGGLITSLTTPDGLSLSQIREYPDHRLHSATISFPDGRREFMEGGKIIRIIEHDGTTFNLKEGKIQDLLYPDGTSIFFEDNLPVRLTSAEGDTLTISYERNPDGEIIFRRFTDINGTSRLYDSNNNLIEVDVPGYGSIPASFLTSTDLINGTPVLIRSPEALFREARADNDFSAGGFSPFEINRTTPDTFSTQVLASDGTYLYLGGVDTRAKEYVFYRVGTGFNGTEKGRDYGDFVRIHQDTLFSPGPFLFQSATYHSDGYIYVKSQADTARLMRIKTLTGEISEVDLGLNLSGSTRITSDGQYLYALMPSTASSNSSTKPATLKIFAPQANFNLLDTYTLDLPNEDIFTISSDGLYLYVFTGKDIHSREVTVSIIDLKSRCLSNYEPFLLPGPTGGNRLAFSSQYDWLNNRYWLTQSWLGIVSETSNVFPFTTYPSAERWLNFQGNIISRLSLDKHLTAASLLPEPRGIDEYPVDSIARVFSVLEDVSGLNRYIASSFDRKLGELTSHTGLLKRLIDKSGNEVKYDYEVSPEGEFITVISSEEEGVKRFNEKGELISLTTSVGDCLQFSSGKPVEFITSKGLSFKEPAFSETGELRTAKLIAPDGTVHLIDKGMVVESRYPDGTITSYDQGLVISEKFPSGQVISRTYTRDENGRIKEEKRSDGTILTFAYSYDENGTLTSISSIDERGRRFFYDQDYRLLSITDGETISLYKNNRVYLITDKNDIPLIEYLYDQSGNLYEIKSSGLHADLEKRLAGSRSETFSYYQKAYEAVWQEVSQRLSEVARSVAEGYIPVDNYLRQAMEIWASYNGPMPRNVHDQLTAMYEEAYCQRDRILSEKLSAYAEIEKNKLCVLASLEENKVKALDNLFLESEELRERLYIQEVIGIVPVYYASILGRTLSESELSFWVSEFKTSGSLTASAIRDYLYNLPEYKTKSAFQSEVISGLRAWFDNYLSLPPEERQSLLASLGFSLTPREITNQEIKRLLRMLEEENIHFTSSAILSLAKLFIDSGLPFEPKELAIETLIIDILAGNITSFKEEDLKLSLYSLSRIAAKHGLNLSAGFSGLEALNSLSHPAMALIEGDHFVTIKEVSPEKVVYYEPNLGPEGKEVVVSPEEFLKQWPEKVILTSNLPDPLYSLSENELLSFRGAGLFSWLKNTFQKVSQAIGNVFESIGRVAENVAHAIGEVVKGIVTTPIRIIENIQEGRWGAALLDIGLIAVSFFTPITNVINNFLTATLSPIFAPIGQALKVVSTTLWNGAKTVVNAIGTGLNQIMPGFTNFTTSLVNNVKSIGTKIGQGIKNIGVSLGYETKGLFSDFTRTIVDTSITVGIQESLKEMKIETPIISSMISSGLTGSLYYGDKKDYFNTSLLTGAARGAVLELGNKLKIDPSLAQIASITLDQAITQKFLGTGPGGIPTLMGELSYYGIRELGESLGIDDRLSQLAGIPIKYTAENSLSTNKNLIPGLRAGFNSLLLERISQEQGIDPLYASIASRTLTSGFTRLFDKSLAQNKTDLLNFFKGSYDGLVASAFDSLPLGRASTSEIDFSIYQAKLFDFSTRLREDSLSQALRTSFISTFHRQAVDDLAREGGLIDYLNGMVNKINITGFGNSEVDKYVAGKPFKQVKAGENEYHYFDLSTDELVMIGQGTYYYDSQYKIPLLRQGMYSIRNEDGKYLDIIINPPSLLVLPDLAAPGKNDLRYIFSWNRLFDNQPPSLNFRLPQIMARESDFFDVMKQSLLAYFAFEPQPPETLEYLASGSAALAVFADANFLNLLESAITLETASFTNRLHESLLQKLGSHPDTQIASLNPDGLIPANILPQEDFSPDLIEKSILTLEKDKPSAIIKDMLFSEPVSPNIFSVSSLRQFFDSTLPWMALSNPLIAPFYFSQRPEMLGTILATFVDQYVLVTDYWGPRLHNLKDVAISLSSDIYRQQGIFRAVDDPIDYLALRPLAYLAAVYSLPAAIDNYLKGPVDFTASAPCGDIRLAFISGFGDPYPRGVMPDYAKNYLEDLNQRTSLNSIGIPAYEESSGMGGLRKNTIGWLDDAFGGSAGTRDVLEKLNTATDYGIKLDPHAVLVAYSGGRNYALKALEMGQYGFETVILVEPPSIEGYFYEGKINNPSTKRVITVYGEKDRVPFVGNNFFKGVDSINIQILGASHSNIFRQPDGTFTNPDNAKFNQMANDFMVRLGEAAYRGKDELNNLLIVNGIIKNSLTGTYTVDLKKLNSLKENK